LQSTLRIESPEAIAKIFSISASTDSSNGLLLCNPIQKKYSLDELYLEPLILNGINELKKANITGKKLTPSLLSYLVKKTNGKTLLSNIELVKNNALLGAKVAKALILLKKFTER
jgi:pseudouridine-5'-phosphate glycosidase